MFKRVLSLALTLLAWAALGCDADKTRAPVVRAPKSGTGLAHAARGVLVDRQRTGAAAGSGEPMDVPSIASENSQAGTSTWDLERPAGQHEVEGYASTVSARAGDHVRLFVSVDHARPVHYELYRMGYYGGLGGRLISSAPEQMVAPQAVCAALPSTGLVECDWEAAFDVVVQPDWITGQYFFKLITEDGTASYIPLVVLERTRKAKLVVQLSVTTWQAYNQFGGASLYRNYLPQEVGFTGDHANAVSFDRPYTCNVMEAPKCRPGSGDFDLGERWLIQWLEQRGVEVAYVTNLDVDLDGDPELLHDRSLFIAVGHDEYWPLGERSALEQARAAGVSLAFMSANTCYWRVRLDASSKGDPRRTVTCYKLQKTDPHGDAIDTTTEYRQDPQPRPEQALIGIMYDDAISRTYFDGFSQVVANQDHWIYAGTGVRNGDYLSHVVGYEFDRAFDGQDAPSGREIVAHANLFNVHGRPSSSDVSLYYPTDHSLVFAAGSIYWARGLSDPGYVDPRIERMTENVLKRAGVALEPTPIDQVDSVRTPSPIEVVAGSGNDGADDGPAASATFSAPVGLARDPDGTLYVSDAASNAIRKISVSGDVTTLAGCGHSGANDGRGNEACFRTPTGLARAADGTLYVADTGNHKLRSVSPDGTVKTIAGNGKAKSDDAADALSASFTDPRGLALAADGTLYIADAGELRKLAGHAVVTLTSASEPTGVALAADGTIYLIATRAAVVQRYVDGGLDTVAGQFNAFGDADGAAADARLRPADGIALDGDRVVFTDSANHKLRVWQQDTGVLTLAGSDGTTLELQAPRGVLVAPDGYIVADTGNHRIVRVRRALHQ
jgi:sugar lactone lactonase YvrE